MSSQLIKYKKRFGTSMHKLEFSLLALSNLYPSESDTASLIQRLASVSHNYLPPEHEQLDVDDVSMSQLTKIFDQVAR